MKKWVKIIIVLAIFFFLVRGIWYHLQDASLYKNTKIPNPPLTFEALGENELLNQLNKAESSALAVLVERADAFQGGIIEFEIPLSQEEFQRVIDCMIYELPNYFYMTVTSYMDADNRILTEEIFQKEPRIKVAKCILYLSCSSYIYEEQTVENGKLVNIKECEKLLSQNNEVKIKEIMTLKEQTETILDEVIKEMPSNIGQREAVEYFSKWIRQNITYDHENFNTWAAGGWPYKDVFELYYKESSTACVVNGKAMCVGFAKTLMVLCHRAGIDAYVCSIIAETGGHAVTAIAIENKKYYIDTSMPYGMQAGKIVFFSEEDIQKYISGFKEFRF